MAGPVSVEELATGTVGTLVGMGTKVIPLRLQEVGGKPLGAVAVVIFQSGGHARSRHAIHDRLGYDLPPALLRIGEFLLEIRVKKDVGQVRSLVESLSDLSEEHTPDDAAPSPKQSYATIVQIPALFLRGRSHK